MLLNFGDHQAAAIFQLAQPFLMDWSVKKILKLLISRAYTILFRSKRKILCSKDFCSRIPSRVSLFLSKMFDSKILQLCKKSHPTQNAFSYARCLRFLCKKSILRMTLFLTQNLWWQDSCKTRILPAQQN